MSLMSSAHASAQSMGTTWEESTALELQEDALPLSVLSESLGFASELNKTTEETEKGSSTELPSPVDGEVEILMGLQNIPWDSPEQRGGCCAADPTWEPLCWDKRAGSQTPSAPVWPFTSHAWLPPSPSSFLWSTEIMASKGHQLRVIYFPCQPAVPWVVWEKDSHFRHTQDTELRLCHKENTTVETAVTVTWWILLLLQDTRLRRHSLLKKP